MYFQRNHIQNLTIYLECFLLNLVSGREFL